MDNITVGQTIQPDTPTSCCPNLTGGPQSSPHSNKPYPLGTKFLMKFFDFKNHPRLLEGRVYLSIASAGVRPEPIELVRKYEYFLFYNSLNTWRLSWNIYSLTKHTHPHQSQGVSHHSTLRLFISPQSTVITFTRCAMFNTVVLDWGLLFGLLTAIIRTQPSQMYSTR